MASCPQLLDPLSLSVPFPPVTHKDIYAALIGGDGELTLGRELKAGFSLQARWPLLYSPTGWDMTGISTLTSMTASMTVLLCRLDSMLTMVLAASWIRLWLGCSSCWNDCRRNNGGFIDIYTYMPNM